MSGGQAALVVSVIAVIIVAAAGPARAGETDQARQLFDFADRLRSEGLHKTAIPQFEKLLKSYPQHDVIPDAIFRLADCHYQLKQYPQAILYYAELTTKYKDKPIYAQSLQRLGQCKMLIGDVDGALAALNEVPKLNPDKDLLLGTHYLIGKTYYLKQDFAQSYQVLSMLAADASPENKYRGMALIMAGDAALRLNKPDDAIKAFTTFLQVEPDSPERDEVLVRAGDAYRSVKNYEQANKHYTQVRAGSPLAASALEGSARSLFMLQKFDDALKQASELIAKYPQSTLLPSGLQIAGASHYELKHYDLAAPLFQRILQEFPKSEFAETALHRLCWTWRMTGEARSNDLIASCSTFLNTYPQSPLAGDVIFLLGEGRHWAKDYSKAIDSYAKVPKDNPSYRLARFMIAACQEEAGDVKKSLETLDAFIAEFAATPDAEVAYQRSISLLLQEKDYAASEKKCNDYLAKYPNGKFAADVTYQKAESLRMQGRHDEMSAAFKTFLSMPGSEPRKGIALYWIARAAQAKGDGLRAQAADKADLDEAAAASDLNKQALPLINEALQTYQECAKLGGDTGTLSSVRMAECHYAIGGATTAIAELEQDAARKLEQEQGKDAAAKSLEQVKALQDQAAASYRTAAELYLKIITTDVKLVTNARAFIWAGTVFQTARERDKAVAIYSKLLEVDPEGEFGGKALLQLGEAYANEPDPDWAKSYANFDKLVTRYKERLKKDPKSPVPLFQHARFGMARALRFQKKFDDAAMILEDVVVKTPEGESLNANALLQLGHVQYARGELARAREIFGRVGLLYDDPQSTPEALFWAGKSTADAGEVLEGAKLWALLLRKYPATKWAELAQKELNNRGIVRDEKGNIKE
ncbi:MAG TPA: tetratricopeptide repeat protein [Planctomycetota bacterium]|nr:tetratricopeptide repeat protein [Planctomycetota bacterium]